MTHAWSGGSTRRWRRLRDRTLAASPLCQRCEQRGLVTPATEVHHVLPISQGGERYDGANLMPLCDACHDALHGARPKGCDARGYPLDPEHWWNKP